MARYKVLKSVAHNIGHSFTSLMNYADDDYVMGHILRFARRGRASRASCRATIGDSGALHAILLGHGGQARIRAILRSSRDTNVAIQLATNRPLHRNPTLVESPYDCDVRITDVRGKDYTAHFHAWWYPERLGHPKAPW
jgi:hypothetical protein